MLWTRLLCPWHFRGSHAWSFWGTWKLGHCTVLSYVIYECRDVCMSLCKGNGWNWTFTSEWDEGNATLSEESINTRVPPWPSVVLTYRGRVSERRDEILILASQPPKEGEMLTSQQNWQRSLPSRLDLPLALKFIFQPLCFWSIPSNVGESLW